MLTAEDIKRIEGRQARIEEKLDLLMSVFGLSDSKTKRMTRQEMDERIHKSVLRFRAKQNKN